MDNTKVAKIETFISAPMSSLNDEQYANFTETINEMILKWSSKIKKDHTYFYYAGLNIRKKSKFETEEIAYEQVMQALERMDIFIWIYPEETPSSTFLELGFALSKNIPIYLYTKRGINIPFILRGAVKSNDKIKLSQYELIEDLEEIILNDLKNHYKNG